VAKRIQNADQKRSQQKSIQQILSISKEINNTAESNQGKKFASSIYVFSFRQIGIEIAACANCDRKNSTQQRS
jgi:hypothetical protein